MKTTEPIRVIVADDQAVVRAGFVNLLSTQEDIEVVGEAQNGHEAVELAAALRPDLALLDIRMPKVDGIQAARTILKEGNGTTKALMLTTFNLDQYVFDALAAGASGFLLKDTTFPELLNAVRVVAAGEAMLAPAVTRRLIAEFAHRNPGGGTAQLSAPPLDQLTAREYEVMLLIARGLSNTEITQRMTITDNTVKTHINRLFSKLGLRDRAQVVIVAYELGLITPSGSG
ncbi:DNA-binding response regulator [Streptomyces spiroverticillatus]|uniref:DNA-binding response regulator n=1 Tax=Streptomyces finlayi TaxID=67296 RepID=A0A918WZU1_9ACTN|nr:response regulator transcription factor [Streptomyces finlayi]GHA12740.1 DNA-binding response regulator [Streptomyces spiroverticillatus]GHC98396.1 DNA-binding response regulator [Streptomyces finlayi]